jgi:putative ABC transport system ATP-binding protein
MIEIKNLTKIYNQNKKNAFQALTDVSLSIQDGELVAIIGKSGAGKSTLLHIIGAIDHYEGGSCVVNGTELNDLNENQLAKFRNQEIGIVMQDFALIEDYTVAENVELPLYFGHVSGKERKRMVKEALDCVGIPELSGKEVNKLSGGQKQRVAIARAIVNNPSYILADEPTGALDSKTGQEILELFKHLNEQGRTVIIITHDLQIAEQCERKLVISDGRVTEASA